MCSGGLACPGLAGRLTGIVPATSEEVAVSARTGAIQRLRRMLLIICLLSHRARTLQPAVYWRHLNYVGTACLFSQTLIFVSGFV